MLAATAEAECAGLMGGGERLEAALHCIIENTSRVSWSGWRTLPEKRGVNVDFVYFYYENNI